MKIFEKMAQKAKDNFHQEGVTIAFLGDSVTQGCFEIYKKENNQEEVLVANQSYVSINNTNIWTENIPKNISFIIESVSSIGMFICSQSLEITLT